MATAKPTTKGNGLIMEAFLTLATVQTDAPPVIIGASANTAMERILADSLSVSSCLCLSAASAVPAAVGNEK